MSQDKGRTPRGQDEAMAEARVTVALELLAEAVDAWRDGRVSYGEATAAGAQLGAELERVQVEAGYDFLERRRST